MPNFYQIQTFAGIQQQQDGTFLPVGSARDARNCCTWDGNLSVAKGYVHHIASAIPGTDRILKLIPLRGAVEKFYAVTAGKVYAFKSGAWSALHAFSTALTSRRISYAQVLIGTVPYLLIATGNTRILKVRLTDDTVSEFGSGLYSYEGTVQTYASESRTITLAAALDGEAIRHITVDGVTIAGKHYKASDLTSYTGSAIVLAATPDTAPAADDTVKVRGGGSTATCNFIGKYYGRLVAAGDPSAPSRLYWSAVSGDGRTIEDWLAVDGSIDASGGYVEVGNESTDAIVGLCVLPSQVLIFKQYSTWRLYGDRPSAYVLDCIEEFGENMSNASVVVKFGTPYFLTKSGLKTCSESGVTDAFGGVRYLKEFLPLLDSVSDSRGTQADNRMYFSCKVDDDAIYDDTVIEFDFATGAIMIRNGFEVADMTAYDGGMFIADGNRYVCRFNEGNDYAGTAINAYWKSQPTDLGAKYASKRLTAMHVRCTAGDMKITIHSDDSPRAVPHTFFNEKSEYARLTFDSDWCRVFSFEIVNKAGSRFCIQGGIDIEFEKEQKR